MSTLAGALLLLAMFLACGPGPPLLVDTPTNGTFTTAPTVLVSGRVQYVPLGTAVLTVNGVVVPIQPDLTWSTSVTLDPVAIVNPILVRMDYQNVVRRQRLTVLAGDSTLDGDFSLEAMAMRISANGLDEMEPVMSGLFALDPATLVPVGTVLDSGCQIPGPFGTCLGSSTTSVANPPPSISGFDVDIVPALDVMTGTITIHDLEIHLYISGSGLVPSCGLRLNATATTLPGSYEVEPDAVDPSNVDVQQTSISVGFTGFQQTFTSGLCDVPIIGDIIQLIIGSLQGTVTQGFQDFLSDPDGLGPIDAPVAEAIEVATAGLDLDGSIGSQIGVNLEAPHFAIDEDPDGLTLGTDARITATMLAPDAPDLAASFHIDEVFPTFGTLTPVGGVPFDLALAIGSSAFNQLLKAEVESGLLGQVMTELDLGGGPTPITAGLLAFFIPELAGMDPATPLELHIQPQLAPFVTGEIGPSGELSKLYVPGLAIELIRPGFAPLVELVVDAQVGLDFDFVAGEIAVTIGGVVPGSLNVDIVANPILTNETVLGAVLEFALDQTLPSLADSFGSFPLPDLLGLQLGFLEASRNGEFVSVFLDLSPTP
jgi:hypothetical protein